MGCNRCRDRFRGTRCDKGRGRSIDSVPAGMHALMRRALVFFIGSTFSRTSSDILFEETFKSHNCYKLYFKNIHDVITITEM